MESLLKAIEEIVGPANVLRGDDVAARRVDWMSGAPCRAEAIVRPADTTELSRAMALCHTAGPVSYTHLTLPTTPYV